MPKNKLQSFDVTFKTLSYLTDAPTPEKRRESIFVQSHIFTREILTAIAALNPEDGLEQRKSSEIRLCTSTLAFIGLAFADEMEEQFQALLELAEVKANEK